MEINAEIKISFFIPKTHQLLEMVRFHFDIRHIHFLTLISLSLTASLNILVTVLWASCPANVLAVIVAKSSLSQETMLANQFI